MEREANRQAAPRIYRLVELNTEQIRALDRAQTVVLLPGGILEEHGPYLPCFTDGYQSEFISDAVAHAIAGRPGWSVLLFPTIPLGANGANTIGGKASFPGSYTVRGSTLRAVYMDLASELGEQGFLWIMVMSLHGARNHSRSLQQACDYFHDVYGGTMVNLLGNPLETMIPSLEAVQSAEDRETAGLDVHGGTGETSCILAIQPGLVDSRFKQAAPHVGRTWDDLRRIAREPDWPGYFAAPARATAASGAAMLDVISTVAIAEAFKVLDREFTGPAVPVDRVPLEDGPLAQRKQDEWLQKNGLQ